MSEIGLFLLVVSAALAVAEAHVPTHGALGGAAVVSLAAGIALVIAGAGVGPLLALTSGLAVAAVGAVYLWIVLNKALAARRTRVRSGPQGLIGRVGEVRARRRRSARCSSTGRCGRHGCGAPRTKRRSSSAATRSWSSASTGSP